jgi:hypothetical protein
MSSTLTGSTPRDINMLKRAPLILSAMGRVADEGGPLSRRPRAEPDITRMLRLILGREELDVLVHVRPPSLAGSVTGWILSLPPIPIVD